jgi:hypothetical protein
VKKKEILVIGDSHAKGLVCNLSSHIGKDFEIMGTVMPGTRLENITNLNIKGIKPLGSNYIVIVCGGSNQINKNESNFGLRQLKKNLY